ncbi:L,D-transpeptidase family protein [Prauserella oleivorans]|uniref:L,D-transpeptidase family protein n=1 Tax=Prauserella oleivorans TaxID=1478153 RepID=A0ABW5WBN7_9PSEU
MAAHWGMRRGLVLGSGLVVAAVLAGVAISPSTPEVEAESATRTVGEASLERAATTRLEPPLPGTGEVQHRLRALGYQIREVTGTWDDEGRHAVVAFQKMHGLRPTGRVGRATAGALDDPVTPAVRDRSPGFHMEVDLTRQVAYTVVDGEVGRIYDVSTGAEPEKATPVGRFHILRQIDGMRYAPLGPLYRPSYFTYDGIAFHGGEPVLPYPASNGCVRMTDPSVDELFDRLRPGTLVVVYRDHTRFARSVTRG